MRSVWIDRHLRRVFKQSDLQYFRKACVRTTEALSLLHECSPGSDMMYSLFKFEVPQLNQQGFSPVARHVFRNIKLQYKYKCNFMLLLAQPHSREGVSTSMFSGSLWKSKYLTHSRQH